MLRRKAYDALMEWKGRPHKPLLVKGQRQVGKTFIIEAFAKKNYAYFVNIDFRSDKDARKVFSGNLDVDSMIRGLEILYPDAVFEPGSTLILFDEIQDCPQAYSSLKYFALDGRYDVIGSGSLLGVALNRAEKEERMDDIPSVPVGFTEHLTMYSLDFEEFLWAKGIKKEHIDGLRTCIRERRSVPDAIHSAFSSYFREYMIVGGMPEVVQDYMDTKKLGGAINIQNRLLDDIVADINKYNTPINAAKTRECFDSIPGQLAESNKKFMYSRVDGGESRNSAQRYSENLLWIKNAGYGNFCYRVSSVETPLSAREESGHFKIYLSDTGLLIGMYGQSVRKAVAMGDSRVNLGAVAENVVAECMVKCGIEPRYYSKNKGENRMELDFVAEIGDDLSVIEVKSGKSREAPSLSKVPSIFKVDRRIMFEDTNIRISDDGVEHYPLYAAAFMDSMGDTRDIDDLLWTEPVDRDVNADAPETNLTGCDRFDL
ncbi:ATP-binding protein [Methanomethylophilus alvi]|uniref:ATP-binding protein n=1 Tax=Methanomethylophilus alvi TaxID=1291540 RepID=UPI0037DD8EF6